MLFVLDYYPSPVSEALMFAFLCSEWETVEMAGQHLHFLGASEFSPHPDTPGWHPERGGRAVQMMVTAVASKAAQGTHEHVDRWTYSLFARIIAVWWRMKISQAQPTSNNVAVRAKCHVLLQAPDRLTICSLQSIPEKGVILQRRKLYQSLGATGSCMMWQRWV